MLFNSIEFLIFFPIVIFLYFIIPHKYRWVFLLTASYYFYMSWKAEYIVLILTSTLVDYFCGLKIYKSDTKRKQKIFLGISLAVNLLLLASFKYFNFFSQSFIDLLSHFSLDFNTPMLKVMLPVGISFYTFQTLSYTIDIYRKKIKPEKHLGHFALYVSFFPQLVAGPIERAKNLLPQFAQKHNFDYRRVTDGIKLMLWGFFKKIVIADSIAIAVERAFDYNLEQTGATLTIATVLFAFQIFCDFSGYSDIAIGAAKIMGFRLMTNFKRPYHARCIGDFWQRWHISLSTWFKDYLYIPLGGSRMTIPRWYLNLFIVFLVSGLWHGANWTFVAWGAIHGSYMIFSYLSKNVRKKSVIGLKLNYFPRFYKLIQIVITFTLINIGWIFFRSNTISQALLTIKTIFYWILTIPSQIVAGHTIFGILELSSWKQLLGLNKMDILVIFSSIVFMEIIHLIQRQTGIREFLSSKPFYLRWSIYMILLWSILLFGVFGKHEFIYFQF